MAAADVVISKPGGLTTAEAMARHVPMLIIDPIPGQESRNSDFLLENGVAMKANNLASLSLKLTRMLTDPGRLELMRSNASRIGKPTAAADVVRHVLSLLPAERRKRLYVNRLERLKVKRRKGSFQRQHWNFLNCSMLVKSKNTGKSRSVGACSAAGPAERSEAGSAALHAPQFQQRHTPLLPILRAFNLSSSFPQSRSGTRPLG